jgi:hypothetical protein
LDDDRRLKDQTGPATYHRLVQTGDSKTMCYVWPSQSRVSPFARKLFGRRTDGFPEKMVPGAEGDYSGHITRGGQPYAPFKGSIMPPPEAVAGTYLDADGKKVKVAPLTDEDRRTILRWIDLGCPIDLGAGAAKSQVASAGWLLDDQRPTLALTYPRPGSNEPLSRILVGMPDYGTGLDADSFSVIADFPIDGVTAGEDLAKQFKALPEDRWELRLRKPITELPKGRLTVSVKDRQGNTTRVERTFSVRATK